MTSINIHDIKEIQTGKREELSCGATIRTIVVTSESGEEIRLYLYADEWEKLTVRGDRL